VIDMAATLTAGAGIESSLDALLDLASATGARLTWGRSRLTRRHWVAVRLVDGHLRVRRARTRLEAARRLLRDVYQEHEPWPFRS
jgi:hypothetical protein